MAHALAAPLDRPFGDGWTLPQGGTGVANRPRCAPHQGRRGRTLSTNRSAACLALSALSQSSHRMIVCPGPEFCSTWPTIRPVRSLSQPEHQPRVRPLTGR